MINVIILPEAEEEMYDSAHYYNQQVSNLGVDFLDEIELAILTIQESPGRWRFIDETIQKYNLQHFPFSIYYEYFKQDSKVVIMSIAHHKREPNYWKKRIN